MSYYAYAGRNQKGKKKKGRVVADSKQDAVALMREQGVAVIELVEVKPSILTREITLGNRVKSRDMVIFLRQFATLIRAGVSIVDSINILSEQSENKFLQTTLERLSKDLHRGQSLSAACEVHKRVFPPLMINLFKAGETGGQLEETLERLASYYEKQHTLKQKVTSAMFYPATVGTMAFGVIIFVMTYVVPTFASMFKSFHAKLPPITLFVLSMSHFVVAYWWVVIVVILAIISLVYIFLQNPTGKYVLHYGILKVPILGKLSQKAEIARMMRTLSSLIASSVPILQSLAAVEKISNNLVIRKVINHAKLSLESGQSLAEPLKESWVFPPLVHHMIAVGEKTGSLDFMLEKIADFYESEVDEAAERIKSLIEPIMIVILSAVVGFIVLAIVLPMFNLYNQIG